MNIFHHYKSDFKENLKLALPIMAGQLGQITVNLVDNIMVGKLGTTSLAAISLSISIFVIFMVIGFGISFGLPPLVSKAHGANKSAAISQYVKHSFVINLVFAFVTILCISLSVPLLSYLGQDSAVVEEAKPYLVITAWTMLPLMIFQTFRTYSDGMSETLPSMIAIIVGNVANIILNYSLIFGKFGMPAMGLKGAAVGSLFARSIMIVVIIGLLYYWKDLWKPLAEINFKRYSTNLFKHILRLGIPTSLQLFFEVSLFSGAAILMGILSKEAQAAHQIAINLASITFLVCSGFGMASTIRVGYNLGKEKANAVIKVGYSAFIQVTVFMAICAIVFIVFRDLLPTIYINDSSVVSLASFLLIMAAIFQIPDGLQVTALGALRGLQDVKVPTLITFISYFIIGIPICIISAFYFDMGPFGIWIGLVISLIVSAVLLMLRFRKLAIKQAIS